MTIAYLGPPGTFTEQALRSEPDLDAMDLFPMRTFVDVLYACRDEEVELGFVAIENAIEGMVNVTMDTLASTRVGLLRITVGASGPEPSSLASLCGGQRYKYSYRERSTSLYIDL